MQIYKIKVDREGLSKLAEKLGSTPYVTIGDGNNLEVRVAISKEELENVKGFKISHN